jgi:hypothetical protein
MHLLATTGATQEQKTDSKRIAGRVRRKRERLSSNVPIESAQA